MNRLGAKPKPLKEPSHYAKKDNEALSWSKRVFCQKYGKVMTPQFALEHECFNKRHYRNKEGKEIVIHCPHIISLKDSQPFYKVYEGFVYVVGGKGIFTLPKQTVFPDEQTRVFIEGKLRTKPVKKEEEKEDVLSKTAKNIMRIKEAYHELAGSG